MKVEKPATMFYQTDHNDPRYFTVCDCMTDSHTICTDVEVDADTGLVQVMFSFETTTPISNFRQRLKMAWNMIFKGYHTEYRDIVMKPQTAYTWCKTVEKAVKACAIKEYMPPSTGGWLSPEQIEKDWPYEDENGRYCLTYR